MEFTILFKKYFRCHFHYFLHQMNSSVAEMTLVHDGSGREENVKMTEFCCDAVMHAYLLLDIVSRRCKLVTGWNVYFKGDSFQKVHKAKVLIVKETP